MSATGEPEFDICSVLDCDRVPVTVRSVTTRAVLPGGTVVEVWTPVALCAGHVGAQATGPGTVACAEECPRCDRGEDYCP